MTLSDELIEIGRQSNPRNNASMAGAIEQMTERAKQEIDKPDHVDGTVTRAMLFAMRELGKEGYSLMQYTFEELNETVKIKYRL